MSGDIAILRRDLNAAITEVAQLKEALRSTNAEVERSRQMTDVLTSLKEQLRTALHTILGFSQLLKSRMRDHDESLENILKAGSQMIDTIEKIMPVDTCGTKGDLQLQPIPRPKTPPDGAFSVLCVEDNPMSLGLIKQILAMRPNIKLFSTNTGKTALPLAREYRPGLILLDLNLPDMHGGDVLQLLRKDEITKGLPVVVISADAAPSQIERLLAAGARNYVTKPFDLARFLYIIDEIVASSAR